MLVTKISVEKFLHNLFKATNEIDMESTMQAIDGVMTNHWIVWKTVSDFIAGIEASDETAFMKENYIRAAKSAGSVRAFFEEEVNSIAMENDFSKFQELLELCLDFTIYISKAKNKELGIAVGPY